MTSRVEISHDRSKTGSDFLQLTLGDAPPGGLSDWLAEQLRHAISDGRIPVGGRLPATRVLAAELSVSRGVVTEAYQRLTEDGHIAGRGRAGTVVVGRSDRHRDLPASTKNRPDHALRRPSTQRRLGCRTSSPGRYRPAAGKTRSGGLPPRAAWLRAERAVLDGLSAADLGYGDPRGTPALRTEVTHWLARTRGIRTDPDEVIVVAGVAQSLSLLGQVLGRHGISAVAMEDPGSLGTRQHLRYAGLATPPVRVDAGGLRVDDLRANGAQVVLVTPAHQFSGRSGARRATPAGADGVGQRRRNDHRGRLRRRAPLRPSAGASIAVDAR
ncbi:aminotransferase class I/II-fold pyridoxal phosphate-dependent enzyme [Fodinicola feengrottensis]|uniref:aminotransferase class I/II-fold pyridoxal phosphate-dependent enzyme n=1 Tax=Fodinicola feengrottensis TaxID=435914 RepID=UPI0024428A37|nr:aminotransferase class I/II-fold pyridoxal phosphate-dependent enzyme [Fodinicola feengrottensis]